MKRYKDFWQDFISYDNAVRAIVDGTRHKRNKRSVVKKLGDGEGGLDPVKVATVASVNLEIIENGWEPSPLRHLQRRCKSTGKIREIDCPTLTDHFIHWMIILAIYQPLTRGMYKYSCGSIPKRGVEYARKTIENWVRTDHKKYQWFVKLDIKKFYESINQEILKSLFRRVIKDKQMLKEIDKTIETIPKGIPIGSYTSQWFANFYLQEVDHFIKQDLYKERRGKRINHVKHYLRYMDDMLLMGGSERDLEKSVRAIQEKLRYEYRLEIKPEWEIKNINEYPIDMIGYRFYPTHTILRKHVFLRTKRLAKKIYKIKSRTNKIHLHDAQGMVSRLGMAKHCNNKELHRLYIKPYVKEKELKGLISYESRKQHSAGRAV